MSRSWAGGSTRRWRRIRRLVLDRDQGKGCRAHREGWCARAGRPGPHTCTGVPTQAHHTLGKAVSGDDPRYLVAACGPCNQHIGDPARAADPPNKGVTKW